MTVMPRSRWAQVRDLFAILMLVLFEGYQFQVDDHEEDDMYWPIEFKNFGEK